MSYQAGSAISYYILDITDAERKAAQLRSVYQGIRQDAASLSTPVVQQTSTSNTQQQVTALQSVATATAVVQSETQALITSTIELGVAQNLTTDQINAQLAALSREALAAGDLVAANELIDASLGEQLPLLQSVTVATVEQTAAQTTSNEAAKALGPVTNSLFGPLALFTTVVGGATLAINSFGNALDFEGKLTEEQRAFGGIIGDFQRGTTIIDQATESGREYGLTQKQITDAFKTLAPIIRESTSTTNDQVGALERLSIINPSAPVEELKKAVEGIQSGNFRALAHDIGLSPPEVAKLRDEVKNGTDVFVALNHVLDDHGITLAVARDRMTGYEGAARRVALASEDLTKAQAELAQNTTGFIDLETRFTVGLTRAFGGAGGLTEGLRQLDAQAVGNRAGQEAYTAAIAAGKDETDAQAIALRAAQQAASDYAYEGQKTTQVLQREADADDRYTASTYKAVTATDALTHAQYEQNKQELANQRAGERSGGLFDTVEQTTTAYDRQHEASAQAAQDAANLRDAQLGYAHATNDTATQRRILNQELKNAAGDPAKELEIRTQLIQLDKEHNSHKISAAQSTALQLNNLAENSGEQQLKIERENLERLRDQQEEFDLRRTRSKEDEERKILGLLARGQRAAAAREREDFAISQKRAQEDYDIARQKTLRNNAEAGNDLNNRTNLRTSQITDRAALRGINTGNLPSVGTTGGTALPPLAAPQRVSATREIAQITLQGTVNLDNKQVGTQLWPVLRVFVDDELSLSITQSNTPASGQTAVSGVTP